jgi:glycosyltransferase involved in cell wall biosynthesis
LVGGQEVQADLLLRLWREDECLCVSYLASNLQLPRLLEHIPFLRTAVRFPMYLAKLLIRARDADILHVFSGAFSSFSIATVPAYCVARFLGKKVLVNYHSGLGKLHLDASRSARNVLLSADRVLVPSSYLVNVFREFGIVARSIPNIVDSDLFNYRPRRLLRPLLLCARNLEACYGIDVVLRAFATIQEAFPEARLWVLGEGSQESALRGLIANLNLRGVELTGRVPREDIARFYEGADILINASRVDNMPVSILEAFACGLAVVTTDTGGIPCIVQHERTGLLSDADDWVQLAANVARLLQDPELVYRLTENAYRQSVAYRWDAIRLQWLRTYEELGGSGERSE